MNHPLNVSWIAHTMNKNHHLTEYLKYYTSLDSPPGFAIMINGEWGSGKTWFLNSFFDDEVSNLDIKTIKISLYGMTSTTDIDEALYRALHPVLSSKGMVIAGALSKALIKGTLKIDLENTSISETEISYNLPDIDLSKLAKKAYNNVIIFDDFERCKIGWAEAFGYINSIVENQDCKAVIITNENTLTKDENEDREVDGEHAVKISKEISDYLNAKEKVVAFTFQYQPQFENLKKSLVSHIKSLKLKNILEENSDVIDRIFTKSGCANLRFLKRQFMSFEILFDKIDDCYKENHEVIISLYAIHLLLSFESYARKITVHNIFTENNGENKPLINELSSKYGREYIANLILEMNTWVAILDDFDFSKETINFDLYVHFQITSRPIEPWTILWNYEKLDHDEYHQTYDLVIKSLINKKLSNEYVVKHIFGILKELSEKEITSLDDTYLISACEDAIDYLFEKDLLDISDDIYNQSSYDEYWGGLSYHCKDHVGFKTLNNYIDNKKRLSKIYHMVTTSNKMIDLIMKNDRSFFCILNANSKGINYHQRDPILFYIDTQKLCEALISSSERSYFGYALQCRYKDEFHLSAKSSERFSLIELSRLLIAYRDKSDSKILKYQITSLIDSYIAPCINRLKDSLSKF